MDLEDLIKYENENSKLDFKKVPYKKESFSALLIDIMSMANADTLDDRFIIVGIKHFPNNTRDIVGIDEFVDDAVYQKLVNDNIEPAITFEYSVIDYEDKKLNYFRIYDCSNPPYMMKKDYLPLLKKGDSFVRKGTHQTKLERKDIDRMAIAKVKEYNFDNFIEVIADCNEGARYLPESCEFILPSEKARKEIESIIELKSSQDYISQHSASMKGPYGITFPSFSFGSSFGPYASRNLDILKENLKTLRKDYQAADAYSLFEEYSSKLNFIITNNGDRYVEDASILVKLKGDFDFLVATEIYPKPSDYGPNVNFSISRNYPRVVEENKSYIIEDHIGQLKHGIGTYGFEVPIRVFIGYGSTGGKLVADIRIFGKNLPIPLDKSIEIEILQVQK
jgi:hypothetical protein